MTARLPTRELPRPAQPPAEQPPSRSPWRAVAAGAIGMLTMVVLVALVWLLIRQAPVDVVPAQPDDVAEEPQAPDAPAEEPQADDDAQQPARPDEPEPAIVYGTELRANWDVTGVAVDDRLNVRTGPGVRNAVVATLAPDTVELESTGRIARVDGALWREIVVPGDGTGWVNARYLAETSPALLDDGRHAAYLHGIDVDASIVTIDVIQFLTGQQAIDAYHAEFPDDPAYPLMGAHWRDTTSVYGPGFTVASEVHAAAVGASPDAAAWAYRAVAALAALAQHYAAAPPSLRPDPAALSNDARALAHPVPAPTWWGRVHAWLRRWTAPLTAMLRDRLRALLHGHGRTQVLRVLLWLLVALLGALVAIGVWLGYRAGLFSPGRRRTVRSQRPALPTASIEPPALMLSSLATIPGSAIGADAV